MKKWQDEIWKPPNETSRKSCQDAMNGMSYSVRYRYGNLDSQFKDLGDRVITFASCGIKIQFPEILLKMSVKSLMEISSMEVKALPTYLHNHPVGEFLQSVWKTQHSLRFKFPNIPHVSSNDNYVCCSLYRRYWTWEWIKDDELTTMASIYIPMTLVRGHDRPSGRRQDHKGPLIPKKYRRMFLRDRSWLNFSR